MNLSSLKPTLLKVPGETGWNPLGTHSRYGCNQFYCSVWTEIKYEFCVHHHFSAILCILVMYILYPFWMCYSNSQYTSKFSRLLLSMLPSTMTILLLSPNHSSPMQNQRSIQLNFSLQYVLILCGVVMNIYIYIYIYIIMGYIKHFLS